MARDGSATRARLLRATTEVVQQVGYSRATTRLIASAAGVAEGSIYRHFPDKPSLFLAAVLERAGGALAALEDLEQRAGRATVRETLVDALHRLSAVRDDVLPLELALLTDPELSRAREQRTGAPDLPRPDRAVEAYLRAEQRLGRVRGDVDPADAAHVLLTLLFGLALHAPGGLDRAALDRSVGVVLAGITGT